MMNAEEQSNHYFFEIEAHVYEPQEEYLENLSTSDEQSNHYGFFETEKQIYNQNSRKNSLSGLEISLGLIASGTFFCGFAAMTMIALSSPTLLSGDLLLSGSIATLMFAAMFVYFAYKNIHLIGESIQHVSEPTPAPTHTSRTIYV